MRHIPQPGVDYEPVPFVNAHQLEPGMIVRPRRPDGQRMDDFRWVVERVSGAFTRCRRGGDKEPTSQYWATDSLHPVKFKRSAVTMADKLAPGAEKHVRTGKAKTGRAALREPDELALALKACNGLDELLAYAAAQGYPDCDGLRAKVSHLNPGLQRMNVGNRLRQLLGVP
jgi:hypothetical protein